MYSAPTKAVPLSSSIYHRCCYQSHYHHHCCNHVVILKYFSFACVFSLVFFFLLYFRLWRGKTERRNHSLFWRKKDRNWREEKTERKNRIHTEHFLFSSPSSNLTVSYMPLRCGSRSMLCFALCSFAFLQCEAKLKANAWKERRCQLKYKEKPGDSTTNCN